HRESGLSRVEAARVGVSEVGLAITLSTLTTVAAFLPIIFMGGNANITFFTSAIGLPLCVAVLGSLLVALVFIPLGTVVFSPKASLSSTSGWLKPPDLRRCRAAYSRVLGVALKNRLAAILFVGLFVVGISMLAMKRVPRVDLVSERGGSLAIEVEMDKNFSLFDADREMQFLGQFLEERMEAYGIAHHWCWYGKRGGRLSLSLTHRDIEKTRALARKLKKELPPRPGVRLDMRVDDGSPEDRGKLNLDVFGPDPERLRSISEEIGKLCASVDGVLSVRLDLEPSDEEIQIRPRRSETARFGADPRVVRGTVEYGIRGFRFGDLLVNEKEIPLIIEYDTTGDIDLAQLRELQVPTDRGGIQPLSALADIKVTLGVGEIRRTNGQVRSRIPGEPSEGQGGATADRLRTALTAYELPNGYRYFETSQDDMKETQKEMTSAVILAVTLVFLLMGIMFESFILPLAVVIAIPFSWAGLLWALAVTGIPLDMIGSIGVIVLVGVVVNNGIVLIDRARRNIDEGLERTAALVDAGLTRFRPIMMTAGTTVVGLLPMAVAQSSSQISYRALSVALIGGLLVSTFFTLVFVPLLFSLFDDLRTMFFRALGSLRASP
ncbi:MAG TPA: efflux RND transporter permease subunit, partial [Planctomycetota bacterium]|nr:efflux RND transporter permease subunit [Planctomycetota bacterium]